MSKGNRNRSAVEKKVKESGRGWSLRVLLALALTALASPSPAATFNYFPAPYNVSPGATGWRDVDVSAYVPVGATGVILQYVETSGVDRDYGVRKKGSTDPFYPGAAKASFQGFMMTGLDSSRVFEVYSDNVSVTTYLIGYTMSGVAFLTNRIDKSTATTGSFVDVGIAADTGTDTAIGAIFHVQNTSGASVNYAVRKKGSTDNRFFGLRADNVNVVIIGVDTAETAQQQIASAALDLYLVGYVTFGAVFFTNGIDKSTGTTGSYVGVDLTSDLGAGVANGAFLEIHNNAGNRRLTAVRPGGAAYDYYSGMQHQFALVGLDAGDVFQQKIENTEMKLFVTGYSLGAPTASFRVKSGSYSGTGLARSIVGLGFQPDVVIIDGVGGGANAVIRTSTMAGTDSKQIDAPTALAGNRITSLDADGFGLGTDADVNQSAVTYYWVAFRAAPGYMKVGTYASTGAAQNVSGVGFTPAYVVVISPNAARAVQRSDMMPANFSLAFDSLGFNDAILNPQPNGFGLGTNSSVAQASTTFHYVAWSRMPGQIAIGSYAGNKADDRNVTGAGFQPEYVLVNRSADAGSSGGTTQGNAPAHKTAASGVNADSATLFDGNVAEADNIQALQIDGFQVGTHCRVNGDATCSGLAPVAYYWAAFGPHTPTTNYRSIGTAANTTGTLSATQGSVTVTDLTATWQTANRGRGDRINIGGTNYTVLAVDSQTQLRLTAPFTAASGSYAYTIARQFTTLQAWEDCVSFNTACPFFPVSSASLVADDRKEVGIAYKETTFVATANVVIDGSTTDALHTITLTADPGNRHDGVPGTGVVVDCQDMPGGIRITDNYVTVEWLELVRCRGSTNHGAISMGSTAGGETGILVQYLLVHNFLDAGFNVSGIRLRGGVGKSATVRNSMLWDGDDFGIEGDEVGDTLIIENCSVDGMAMAGIQAADSALIVRNTISTSSGTADFDVGLGSLGGSNNTSSDLTAPGANPQTLVSAASVFVNPNVDLHLRSGPNAAVDTALDLSASFSLDIDGGSRAGKVWDRGADERDVTTAVELVSFQASGLDGAVDLMWETASELSNLGFHLYRMDSESGAYSRITSRPIPGLGSSPVGAKYVYRDNGLANGTTYFYMLEDIETTGATEKHGPVSAMPSAGHPSPSPETSIRMTYGRPEANAFRILERGRMGVVLELATEGFTAEPQEDGSVRLDIPGFEPLSGSPSVPILRPWVDALPDRGVAVASVRESSVVSFPGLRPSGFEKPEMVAGAEGTVTARPGSARRFSETRGLVPEKAARLLQVGFQGDSKKAQLEIAPLRWNGATGELVLARKLTVHLVFRGVAREGHREGASHRERGVVARLVTSQKGLHEVPFETLFGGRRGVATDALRLSRLGKDVAFHVEPRGRRFGPGSKLYFVSEGPEANPYGNEVVYEVDLGGSGARMESRAASPSGEALSSYFESEKYEETRFYQAGLLEAPDLWLWDVLMSGSPKSFVFRASDLAPGPSRVTVWLQGVSDFDAEPDHHLRLSVNGSFQGEVSWDGKNPRSVELDLLPGVLQEGDNRLEIENLGDTGAPYSMVMLDRFEVVYPRLPIARAGALEGTWPLSGTASVHGLGAFHLLDVTESSPQWLAGAETQSDGSVRFRAEEGRRYLAVSRETVPRPRLRSVTSPVLKKETLAADYLVLGPRAFSSVAVPLLERRSSQGLRAKFASVEDIFSEFGFGEARPEAIRDFLAYAYHHWREPKLRYVLLLGDATYDFKDYLRTGVSNQIPPLMVKTSYLWTVSDPSLAAVHGDDILPDVAVGRLPARSSEELQTMVEKILAYETGDAGLGGVLVLATDNSDRAGDFASNADEISSGVLSGTTIRRLHLSELGGSMRSEILRAFDDGASLVSYIGHGGIHLWADENVFNTGDVLSLSPQSQQPVLLTMNCLNGYFHFPYFDSLAEALVKAEAKGAIAAFSPSGLSVNEPAHRFHQAVLDALFNQGHRRLGDAILAAQERYAASGAFPELLTIYHLLGDPALRLR